MKSKRTGRRFPAFFLAVSLVLSLWGCAGEKTAVSQDALLCYPGLEWNMTPEEVLNALSREESDCVPEEGIIERNSEKYETFSLPGLKLFGKETQTVFSFVGEAAGRFGLEAVYVLFPEDTNFEAVRDSLTDQLGKPSLPLAPSEHALAWDSETPLKSYVEAVYGGVNNPGIDEIPAGRIFWTDNAKFYFQCFGLTESGWRNKYNQKNILVFEGYLTKYVQLARSKAS